MMDGNLVGISANEFRAAAQRTCRESASLQCRTPSTSDHKAPAACASSAAPPSSRAPTPKRMRPRSRSPSVCGSPHGNGSSNGNQASSSVESSSPLIPCANSSPDTACSRGSAGAGPPASSSWSRSRHHAMRIAPSAGCVVLVTMSANARSRCQSASKAGLTFDGVASSAVSRSRSSRLSAIADGLHRLDDLGSLDERQLLEVGGIGERHVHVRHAQHRRVEIVEPFGHGDGDDL